MEALNKIADFIDQHIRIVRVSWNWVLSCCNVFQLGLVFHFYAKRKRIKPSMVYGYVWLCMYVYIRMAIYVWLCMHVWLCMAMYVWPCMYGNVCMAIYGWLFMFFLVSYVEERPWWPMQSPNKGKKKAKS